MFKDYVRSMGKLRAEGMFPSMCHFFVGNEACDADSMISALCFAYYNYRKQSVYNCVPVWHIKREELYLRRDVALLLEMVDIDIKDLLCITDFSTFASVDESPVHQVSLLDHNVLHPSLAKYNLNVVDIQDHHVDAGQHASLQGSNRNIAFDGTLQKQLVGSTCTLIAEHFFTSPALLCSDVATLLMGVIALDTFNMDPASIGTSRDAEALQKLGLIARYDRTHVYDVIRNAKLDLSFWQSLSAEHALALDYKRFTASRAIGMSSVLLSIDDFLLKKDALGVVVDKMKQDDVQLYVLLSFVLEPAKARQILLVCHNEAYIKLLAEYLMKPEVGLDLVLLQETCGDIFTCLFTQLNLKASRKQVAPIILDFDKEYK